MIIGILGILKAGAAYLPLAPDNPHERIKYMLEETNAHALLIHEPTKNKGSFGVSEIDLDDPSSAGVLEESDKVEPACQVLPANGVLTCARKNAHLDQVVLTVVAGAVSDAVGPGADLGQ